MSNKSQVPTGNKLQGLDTPLTVTDVPCPCCRQPGLRAGEANGERATVYWCHTEDCKVRSFTR